MEQTEKSIIDSSSQTGLIGFFDILGYKNLLQNNDPEAIAKTILPFLINISVDVNKSVDSFVMDVINTQEGYDGIKKSIGIILQKIGWAVFSDTILMTSPLDKDDELTRLLQWPTFIRCCYFLQKNMFEAGLPVRGVINYGDYYIKGSCFAGSSIVDAFNECKELNIAACVISNKMKSNHEKGYSSIQNDAFVCEYLFPLKSGEKKYYGVMAPMRDVYTRDIREYVLRSFWKNNKDIPVSAQDKVQNTVQYFTYVKQMIESEKAENKK